MQNIDRRDFLYRTLASLALGLLPCSVTVSALASDSSRSSTIKVLKTFLEKHLVSSSMQCGSRLGDGVPEFSDVEKFMAKILKLANDSTHRLEQYLADTRNKDLVTDNTMTVDGWVLARTEVLSAASYVLMTNTDCQLPT